MIRVLLGCAVAAVLAAPVAASRSAAVLLDRDALQMCRAGVEHFCVDAIADTAGVDCHECMSNGSGGSIKCDSTANDMASNPNNNQSPAEQWEFTEQNCGGGAKNYTGGGCMGIWTWVPCGRQFTRAGFMGYPLGVDCD